MKLKAIPVFVLTSFVILSTSCQEKKELQEVQIPDAIIFQKEAKSVFPNPKTIKTTTGPFQMEGLKYQYEDFKDFLDPENIYLHYAKHHLGYAHNLNRTLIGTPLEKRSIEIVLGSTDIEHPLLKSYSGGYYNHNIYWKSICKETDSKPSAELLTLINRDFGSLDGFKEKFKQLANQQIGSGWAWVMFSNDKLILLSTPNEDNPLMPMYKVAGIPILAIDLWEHAYYPTHKNNKKEYIDRFVEHINWAEMSRLIAPAAEVVPTTETIETTVPKKPAARPKPATAVPNPDATTAT
ncbi:superoxide dismutase [Flavobacterium sp. NKUCC04_CG]|uniref:superoxide dismutase n=1 Tax=Flavobacterium sp. NKUCC04_CG TaxID=2842121 RepID=UPI001C5AAD40|nr:superoxide dismutase [Flavobacterium sp. NKUCC04_CG]MBW3519616.1 superoxide dismutase [Flavobacterium sp. NKUCC04_CG]